MGGNCSVTCETGIQKRVFKVISPAKSGGQACLHRDGDEGTRPCGRTSDTCPTTTTIITTTTTTTTTAAPTAAMQTTLIDPGAGDNEVSDGAATATATAMMMTIACLTLLKV